MMFYNGFNLLIDLILIAGVYVLAHGIGYQKGKGKGEDTPF
jgi:hypothetical protein